MPTDKLYNDITHFGATSFRGVVTLPDDTIVDAKVNADADIGYDKVRHVHHVTLAQPDGTAATTEDRIKFIARAACTILAVDYTIMTAAAGAATVDIDVETSTGGGAFATILTGPEQIDNATVVRVVLNGTLDGAQTMAVNDLLLISLTATAGGGTLPQGVSVDVTIAEQGQ